MQHDATCLSTREASAFPGRSSRTLDRYRVICEGPTFSKFASHVWYSKADAGLLDEEREPARLDSYDSIVEHFTERPDLFVRVTDDSLDRAGYRAGDIVAARRASDARAGDLVVARAGARVTLRRLAAAGSEHLELRPESTNAEHVAVQFDARSPDIEIVAVVVGAIVAARRASAEGEA